MRRTLIHCNCLNEMADPATYFCDDAAEARDRFLDLCTRTGLTVRSTPSQQTGLSCDFTRLGAPSADHLIVLASGAGGAAGYVNAGLCSALLGERLQRHLGRNVAILLVHAVNPTGPSWPSPGSAPPAPNDDAGHGDDAPWNDALLNAADARFRAHMKAQHGTDGPDEITLDGTLPAWTRDDAALIARAQMKDVRFALFLDFRTGLGGWADPNFVSTAKASDPAYARARRWYPNTGSGPLHTPSAPQAVGLAEHLGDAAHALVTVEFGTFRQSATLGTLTSSDAAFDPYPKSMDWRTRVWRHAETAILQGIGACEEMAAAQPASRQQNSRS